MQAPYAGVVVSCDTFMSEWPAEVPPLDVRHNCCCVLYKHVEKWLGILHSVILASCILSGGGWRRVQDVTALTGDGLRAGLQWLVDQIRKSDRAVLLRQRN